MASQNNKYIVGGLVVALIAIIAIAALNMPDRRTPGEKVGDAIGKIGDGQGLDDAARELKDRTPAERITDGVKDATDGNPQ